MIRHMGTVLVAGRLARQYGFTHIDGNVPRALTVADVSGGLPYFVAGASSPILQPDHLKARELSGSLLLDFDEVVAGVAVDQLVVRVDSRQ